MRKNIRFIKELASSKTKSQCQQCIQKGGKAEIITIAELVKNILALKLPIQNKDKHKLCHYKRQLRMLASRRTNYKQKRDILQGAGVAKAAGIIANLFLPHLMENFDGYT
jgi:hypothetical protein